MKVGIISDVHANLHALEAVLEELEVEKIICAGDLIGYGTNPNEVIEELHEEDVEAVKGNHDAKAVHQIETKLNPSAELALEYNREDLKDENWEYLEQLPKSKRVEIDGVEIAIFHGSPQHELTEYVYRDEVDEEFLDEHLHEKPDLVVFGHTHAGFKKELEETTIVNPGSVGQPRDRNPDASYAVLDTEKMSVEIKRTSYDVDSAAEEVNKKFTERLAERLLEGR